MIPRCIVSLSCDIAHYQLELKTTNGARCPSGKRAYKEKPSLQLHICLVTQ